MTTEDWDARIAEVERRALAACGDVRVPVPGGWRPARLLGYFGDGPPMLLHEGGVAPTPDMLRARRILAAAEGPGDPMTLVVEVVEARRGPAPIGGAS